MTIRAMKTSDIEPLHRLYSRLAARIPNHPKVSLEQFATELKGFGTGRMEQRTAGAPRRAFVAVRTGLPVAFASTAVCTEGFWELATGQGVLRFVFAPPGEQEACVELIRRATARIRADGGERPMACVYGSGPGFHNWACAMVPSAWPWIGHWLCMAGYAPAGSEIRMRRVLEKRPRPIALPKGSELRVATAPESDRVAEEFQHHRHLWIDGQEAAQCHNFYEERFVRGRGKRMSYTEWLGVNEAFRGRGLGRAMLRNAVCRAYDEGCRVVTLTTDGCNFHAQALYVSEGYAQTDTMWRFGWGEEG
ncbi:MAG TPA: GNAT family N-acetyltransferase [Armatimonadota bacterium]|nr:GNAT family N-acetyltransferase [Armatimonadota bacterium]